MCGIFFFKFKKKIDVFVILLNLKNILGKNVIFYTKCFNHLLIGSHITNDVAQVIKFREYNTLSNQTK